MNNLESKLQETLNYELTEYFIDLNKKIIDIFFNKNNNNFVKIEDKGTQNQFNHHVNYYTLTTEFEKDIENKFLEYLLTNTLPKNTNDIVIQIPQLPIYTDKHKSNSKKSTPRISSNNLNFNNNNSMSTCNAETISKKTFKCNSIKTQNNNSIKTQNPNFIIIGGGPNGIYMSILLKYFFNYDIIIISNKHTKKLTRKNYVLKNIDKLFKPLEKLPNFDIFSNNKYFSILNKHIHEIIKKCSSKDNIQTNVLEYSLLNYAKKIGVTIICDEGDSPDNKNINYDKYINDETLLIFDATGGRLNKIKYSWKRLHNTKSNNSELYNNSNLNHSGFHRKGINITNITTYKNNINIITIGDSYLQLETYLGIGIIITFSISIVLVLSIKRIIQQSTNLKTEFKINIKKTITKKKSKKLPVSLPVLNINSLSSKKNYIPNIPNFTNFTNPYINNLKINKSKIIPNNSSLNKYNFN
jgi:hypothetical protein